MDANRDLSRFPKFRFLRIVSYCVVYFFVFCCFRIGSNVSICSKKVMYKNNLILKIDSSSSMKKMTTALYALYAKIRPIFRWLVTLIGRFEGTEQTITLMI